MSNPFDEAASSLSATIERAVDAPVTLRAPRSAASELAVDVHLLGVRHGSRELHRGLHRLPVELEFLVAVTGPGDETAALLHDVLLAVDASTDHDLTRDDVPVDWWLAFGVPPRPALRVTATVDVERTVDVGPIVTELLHIEPQLHRSDTGAVAERRA